ncbi:MAG: RsmD family RNA methyltransferase [Gammaproteobacteria bacterium]|nr:RsmD family RNA methyltransferase [Gammaproteobacteria bacterium]MBQ0774493.1 RsmD family RNA methyltransferase [Gammaproteobacteria bacterium]
MNPNFDGSLLKDLEARYMREKVPINVSFRNLVGHVKGGERYAHYIHSYPAKLLPHIPIFFLESLNAEGRGGIVLDPFCGSGTVGLEAIIHGRKAVLYDTNPLACLISKVKTKTINELGIQNDLEKIMSNAWQVKASRDERPNVVNRDYWFQESVQNGLMSIRKSISDAGEDNKDFFWMCFSSCCHKVSNTDKRLSVPVKPRVPPKAIPKKQVIELFSEICTQNIKRMLTVGEVQALGECHVYNQDSRRNNPDVLDGSVDVVITSPPYAGAQKYIRSSSLSLGWLGMAGSGELRPLEKKTVGREHLIISDRTMDGVPEVDGLIDNINEIFKSNAERAYIISCYMKDMNESLAEMFRVLKRGGDLILIMGDNTVVGKPFSTAKYVVRIAEKVGFVVRLFTSDRIVSRSLMTKRNGSVEAIAHEHVIWMKKI